MDSRVLKTLISSGFAIEKNRVSFAPYTRLGKEYYQVHSDNYKCRESHMFKENELDKAIEKFVYILNKT